MVSICPHCKRITSGEKICPKCGADTTKPPKQIEETDKEDIISAINQSLADNHSADMIVYPKQKGSKGEGKSYKIPHKKNAAPWIIAVSSFVGALAIFGVVMLLSNKISVNNSNATATSRGDIVLNFSVEGAPEEAPEEILEDVPKSPIDALNDQERLIYESLMIGVKDFYNPQAVRVLDVYEHGDDRCYVTITGTNKLGATLQKFYILRLVSDGTSKKGDMLDWTDFEGIVSYKINYKDVDVGNINRAIKQHWEDMGID